MSRELTKKFEEQIRNTQDKLIEVFQEREIIGEITIVIKGIDKHNQEINKSQLKKELKELQKTLTA